MIFNSKKKHTNSLYNTLLQISRNILFYEKFKFKDTFDTRLLLIFFHFSIILNIFKYKHKKTFDQDTYDSIFNNIEYDLREQGMGDVNVNKKMKMFNRYFYDILLKINHKNNENFEFNNEILNKYFMSLNLNLNENLEEIGVYFNTFHKFCFDLDPESIIRGDINYNN
tara:strand:- start:48 stop:551 length:504 start_codon:yes stop_codon:yes gene_type:complete